MTSEIETLKTNEFLRRRKLRLQQVREQSKDIAKKIRQRAKVETIRQVVDLDAKKQKEYFERQEKLVKRLEVLYARGLNNVGVSHQSASELTQDGVIKTDLSKLRGREAAAELRRKRQEKLDQQKKLLDRKLQARETANIISREKSSAVASKLTKATASKSEDTTQKLPETAKNDKTCTPDVNKDASESVTKNDMATQWSGETMPNEWEPVVPALALSEEKSNIKDDQVSLTQKEQESKSDQSRKLDLFAVSKEMPSDLCGQHVHISSRRETIRPSLTLVSEYLQTRNLRLRETEPATVQKKSDDISQLKQTILRTRANKAEGRSYNMCQVLDEQIIPVPSWHAERSCEYCANRIFHNNDSMVTKQFTSVTNSQINTIFSSIRPVRQSGVEPRPVLRSTSPFRRSKVYRKFISGKNNICTDSVKTDHNTLNKKSSVTMYNHNTRDTRDLPCSDEQLVVRDQQTEEDAYAQALKESVYAQGLEESLLIHVKEKEHQKKVQDMRNKVAVTKQTVEKEYKDTINFLNSLPKDKGNKVTKTAYMDERRQQLHNENRQHKMQQEYRKIEKECRRHHSCMKKGHSKSKSPAKQETDDDFNSKDFQYSWMPVPEGDGNLAVHTIPNSVKEGKSGNTVKFSTVDSYHEYRSRHKHTPPTKDTTSHEKHPHANSLETIVSDIQDSQSIDDSSTISDSSSIENLRIHKKKKKERHNTRLDQDASDAERIIIYKILDSKSDKQVKKKNKLLSDIAKSLSSIEKVRKSVSDKGEPVEGQQNKQGRPANKIAENSVSFEHINEGVYKVTEEKKDNMSDTISSNDHPEGAPTAEGNRSHQNTKPSTDMKRRPLLEWDSDCVTQPQRTSKSCHCSAPGKENAVSNATGAPNTASTSPKQPQTSSSSSSFKTASNEKGKNAPPDGSYIKLVDKTGLETGKFFLGNTEFLKDDAYEVVIQLRKKDISKDEEQSVLPQQSKQSVAKSTVHQEASIEIDESIHLVTSESDGNLPLNLGTDKALLNFEAKKSSRTSPWELKESGNTAQTEVESKVIGQNIDQTVPCTTNDDRINKASEEKENVSDKGTNTNDYHQKNYPIEIPRAELPSRPATTTYTQTSSPLQRPVYVHMSSSTSTAYMSPPDMILPNFLRHDPRLTEYETCGIERIDTTPRSVDNNKHIKQCRHVRKANGKGNTKFSSCKKNRQSKTPPNSVRSIHTADKPSTAYDVDHDKCKCPYCSVSAKDQYKTWFQNSKQYEPEIFRSSRNRNLVNNIKDPQKYRHQPTRVTVHKKSKGPSLNPIVKDYINKLLSLNKQGLKAIEVADQECSSVGTPGSSIINVPYNIDDRKSIENKISLEHIKKTFMRQIMHEHLNNCLTEPIIPPVFASASKKYLPRKHRKTVHKVKSLNISKHLLKKHINVQPKQTKPISISTTTDDCNKSLPSSHAAKSRPRSSTLSKPGQPTKPCSPCKQSDKTELTPRKSLKKMDTQSKKRAGVKVIAPHLRKQCMSQRTITDTSLETDSTKESHNYYKSKPDIPVSMSTQTSQNNDSDFMKLAEDKLHNMEKIADLTEKCTKRLSNLAKVLEEVRKNKSLVYSQISTSDSSDSHSDHKSDKMIKTPVPIDLGDVPNTFENSPEPIPEKECIQVAEKEKSPLKFVPFLTDIPKPAVCPLSERNIISPLQNVSNLHPITESTPKIPDFTKCKLKPPPALSRIHLKHAQEDIVPHELSTVIEVDSPMSIKNKTQSSRRYDSNTSNRSSNEDKEPNKNIKTSETSTKQEAVNPDLIQGNPRISKQSKFSSTQTSDDSKFQMIDLKHFNEIMLEPFISIHEYAKKYNVEAPDEMSNIEDLHKEDVINDDMSSLHSDGSLPDVIAELLKRNIIAEPFKFDTGSNVNSTTISSESTLSMLALSKARTSKKRPSVAFRNKENIGETSDTLSISSNPDLEHAFKKLGMGWASSTLKKTKERLALSSSSNTSSSSISHLKIKSFHQEIPALVTDSVSSVLLSKTGAETKNFVDNSKDAKHQTSFPNSMTVNEFLANELANKITFTSNKTGINDTEEEFVSLFETKIPEGMNQQTPVNCAERSNDSVASGVNRARTSTPVQIFKSMTYHSSSGSNTSNGLLFSNADDLSSVKMTSNSMKNHSTSDKDELTIPNFSLKLKKGIDSSKSD